jgi:L-threonylcarbamoyladenylate synthase
MPETVLCPDLSDALLREAARVVRAGGVIAYPTDTFYGLGACPFDADAVRRVFDLKGRSTTASPVLVLIRSRADLKSLVSEFTPAAERLMEAFWPGPLTLVFRAAPAVPAVLTAGTGTIGVRLPAHPDTQRVLEAVGGPLTGTSANRTGDPPARTAEEVRRTLGADVDVVLNGGATPGGPPSTVLDTTVTPPRLIREGRVTSAALRSVIGSLAP